MPNTKSAKKNWKQSLKARARNRKVKTVLKNELKAVRGAAATGNAADAVKNAVSAQTKLDRAASRKIIHRNKAARLKSRISKLLKSAKAKK